MPLLRTIIDNVLRGENVFCCLCFKIHKNTGLKDKIIFDINDEHIEVPIMDVLLTVLGEDIQGYLCTFQNVCEECVNSAIDMYAYKQKSKYNSTQLIQALNTLSDNIDYTKIQQTEFKSLFVSFKLEDFTSNQFYDTEKYSSVTTALQRYQSLTMTKEIKEETNKAKDKILQRKAKHQKYVVNIKTKDMLHNPHDDSESKCKECLKVYPSIWDLRNHFLRVHAPKNYKCHLCKRAYGAPYFLNYHLDQSHCQVMCSECGKTFKNKQTLKKHEEGHNLKLVCPDCGRVYKSKVTFNNHIKSNVCKQELRANPADAKFTCDYCNKKYTQKMSLRVHIQYEHGNYKSHVCEWCGKKFWAQSRLKLHIVKHTREKPFSCSHCQGKFVSKESLLYHTRIHTGEKPYKCKECECSFLSASRRSYHMKTYHIGATIQCDTCPSKFTSQAYLEKHKRYHKQQNELKKEKFKDTMPLPIVCNSRSLIKKDNSLMKISPEKKVLIPVLTAESSSNIETYGTVDKIKCEDNEETIFIETDDEEYVSRSNY